MMTDSPAVLLIAAGLVGLGLIPLGRRERFSHARSALLKTRVRELVAVVIGSG
jgi:hypothetical protein